MLIKSRCCVLLLKQESLLPLNRAASLQGRAISCLGFPDMSSFSVLGAPSKQIFEQVQLVPGFWEFPTEARQRAWQVAAGNGRTVVSGGRQQEKEEMFTQRWI